MESDYSISDCKKQKNLEKFSEKSALNENSCLICYSNFTHETKTSFFCLVRNDKLFHLVAWNVILDWYFYRKGFNFKENQVNSEKNYAKCPVSAQKFKPR